MRIHNEVRQRCSTQYRGETVYTSGAVLLARLIFHRRRKKLSPYSMRRVVRPSPQVSTMAWLSVPSMTRGLIHKLNDLINNSNQSKQVLKVVQIYAVRFGPPKYDVHNLPPFCLQFYLSLCPSSA